MGLLAHRILALLASASVLFAGVHCVCASAGRSPGGCHAAAAPVREKRCCSHPADPARPVGDSKQPGAPCDRPDGHQPGCPHCQPALEAKAGSADPLKVSAPAFPHLLTLWPVRDLGTCDRPTLTPATSGDLPPPGDGRTRLRLYCTLLI